MNSLPPGDHSPPRRQGPNPSFPGWRVSRGTRAIPTHGGAVHSLIASPFLGQYLVLRPGHANGVRIPEARYEELRATVPEGQPVPAWLHEAAAAAWQMSLPAGSLRETILVRQRSAYGYAKASWEINLGCDHDCGFCYLGEKRFEGLGGRTSSAC